MSADAAGDGEALGAGVEEESPKLAPSDFLAATSTIAAVDKSPLDVMSNTLCLKLGRFGVEECSVTIFEGAAGETAPQGQGQRGEGGPRATRPSSAKGNAAGTPARKATGGRRREGNEGEATANPQDAQIEPKDTKTQSSGDNKDTKRRHQRYKANPITSKPKIQYKAQRSTN